MLTLFIPENDASHDGIVLHRFGSHLYGMMALEMGRLGIDGRVARLLAAQIRGGEWG